MWLTNRMKYMYLLIVILAVMFFLWYLQSDLKHTKSVLTKGYLPGNYFNTTPPQLVSTNYTSALKVKTISTALMEASYAPMDKETKVRKVYNITPGEDTPLALEKAWSEIPSHNVTHFPRVLNNTQYNHLINLLERVDRFFTDYNITWTLCFGTLLGSYMSHNLLPWDDDLDICIYHGDVKKTCQLYNHGAMKKYNLGLYIYQLSCQDSTGEIFTTNLTTIHKCDSLKMKLYDSLSTEGSSKYEWSWPFVDVLSFDFNSTFGWINNMDPNIRSSNHMVTHDKFFPLHNRPFGRLFLPSPASPRDVLASRYTEGDYGENFSCKTSFWNHIKAHGRAVKMVECKTLAEYYPFVHREQLNNGKVLETLCIGSTGYYSFMVTEHFRKDWQPTPYELMWK